MATARARGELELDLLKWESGLKRAESQLKGFESRVKAIGRIALFAGGIGLAAATAEISAFETETAKVRALTKATAEEYRELVGAAQEFGANTRFSATQAASGMAFLAQAGFDANQILKDTPEFLNLAAAGGLELARAMDIASNVLSPFAKLQTDSAAVADTLALTASSANTSVEQLGEAMKAAAPIAASLGKNIGETAAAIGVLGDAGIQGEAAGTAYRNMLLRLVNPTSEVLQGMATLGLEMRDLNPVINSTTQIFENIARAQADLGDKALAAAANQQIFGIRAAAAGAVLTDSVGRLRDLTAENENARGSAKRLADEMNNNLGGAILAIESRFKAVILAIGDGGFRGALREIINSAANALADFVNSGAAAELGGKLGAGITIAVTALTDFSKAIIDAGTKLAENRNTIVKWGKALAVAYGVAKAFQLGAFIKAIAASTAAIITNTRSTIADTAAKIAQSKAAQTAAASNVALAASNTAVARSAAAAASATSVAAVANAAAAKVRKGGNFAGAIDEVTGALAAGSAKAGNTAVKSFGGVLLKGVRLLGGPITAAITGWQIGKFLDEQFNFSGVGAGLINLVTGVQKDINLATEFRTLELQKQLRLTTDIAEKERIREKLIERENQLVTLIAKTKNSDIKQALTDELDLNERVLESINKQQGTAKEGLATARLLQTVEQARDATAKRRAERQQKAIAFAKQEVEERKRQEKVEATIAALREDGNIPLKDTVRIAKELQGVLETSGAKLKSDFEAARTEAAEAMRLLRAQAGVSGEDGAQLETQQNIAKLAKEIAAAQGISGAEAVKQARERLSLETQIKENKEKALAADREAQRLAREATAQQDKDNRKKKDDAEEALRVTKARRDLFDEIRLLEAQKTGKGDAEAIETAIRLRQLTEQIQEEQKFGFNESLRIAKQILSLERKKTSEVKKSGGIRLSEKALESAIGRSVAARLRDNGGEADPR